MKGVFAWLKSHLLMVVSTVVIVASLPTGWFFSSGWNKEIKTQQEKRANQAYNKIKNAKVTYVIPSLLPGEEPITESRPPNPYVTEFYKTQRALRQQQASGIVGEVEGFNEGGHRLLAPDLLPVPVSVQQETRLKYAFLAKMAGDQQLGQRSIYHTLFESIGAGGPPDAVKLATSIQDLRDRETERMLAESATGSVSAEGQAQLTKLLTDRRLAEAQRRAKEISVYAGMSSFDPQGFGTETAQIPPPERGKREATEAPTLDEVFEWNFDYWVVSDLLLAVDHANTDAGGTRANVENAVVKRIERLSVEALPLAGATDEVRVDPYGEPIVEPTSEGADPSVSVTGRISTEAYDVVNARVTLVVDAARIPRLFQAIAETNLMTVLDMDITEVDIWGDLRQGYFYGNAPVVRVSLEIETIWLREWTTPMMPESVKKALGMTVEDDG